MKTPQLLTGTLALAVFFTAACNRTDTRQEAREAAAEVKTAAANAGEKLADGWLTTKIQAQYFADDDVKSRYINVSTRDGVVTIKGYVESPEKRELALQIARNTDGVKQVNDQLLIGRPAKEAFEAPVATSGTSTYDADRAAGEENARLDDERITSTIQAKYFLDSTVKARQIDVAAQGGVVTLKGQVASEAERNQALQLARGTAGVQRVEDHLTVDASLGNQPPIASNQPPVGATTATPPAIGTSGTTAAPAAGAGVRSEDMALESKVRTKVTANGVEISARDGVILVQGSVASQAERQKIIAAVRGTEGVTQVVDRLTVAARR